MSLKTAACLLALSASATVFADTHPMERGMVHLQAEASRDVQNDEMRATFYTEQSHKVPTVLANQINQTINAAMTAAKKFPQVQVSTAGQNTYPIYDDKNRLTTWRTRANIELKSTDFRAMSELMAQLQEQLQLGNINFEVSAQQRKTVENELLTELTQSFRQRASILQNAWGSTGYELVNININTDSQPNRPYPVMMMRASGDMAEKAVTPQNMEAGNSKIQVSASGVVQLKP
ncbi:MAG: SIMPL domain-containing protein [Pseudomonadota bacterium]|nr:SIMPL domain-containing protein [Pseudomonadota bacterium]